MLSHEQIGFDISYSRLRYILMGGSVLAALLIISIGEWGGDEALHCAAERNFTLLSGKNLGGRKTSQWSGEETRVLTLCSDNKLTILGGCNSMTSDS